MQDERRHPNGWEHRSKVSLYGGGGGDATRSGAHAEPLVASGRASEPLVLRDAGCDEVHDAASSPPFFAPLEEPGHQIGGEARRIIDVAKGPGRRVDQDQRRGPLGVGRGEEQGHLSAPARAEERRPLRARGIHDPADVVRPLLQRGDRGQRHRVRDARPALVEAEDPAERREAAKEPCEQGLLPHHLDIAGPPRDEHQVQRAVPDDLIGDVAVLAPGVPRLGLHRPAACPRECAGVNGAQRPVKRLSGRRVCRADRAVSDRSRADFRSSVARPSAFAAPLDPLVAARAKPVEVIYCGHQPA